MAALLLPLGVFVVMVYLLAQSTAAQTFTGSQSQAEQGGIVGWLKKITGASIGGLLIGEANKAIRGTISRYAVAHLLPFARWLHALNAVVRGQAKTNADLAEHTAAAVTTVMKDVRARTPRAVTKQLDSRLGKVQQTASVAKANAHTAHTALDHYKVRTNARLNHAEHSIAVTLPHSIAHVNRRVGALDKTVTKDKSRLRELEDGALRTFEWIKSHPFSAATGVFTGAVALALAKLGYPFLRCSSWRNLGKSMKCSDANVIRSLLTLATDFLVLVNICQVIPLLSEAYSTVAAPFVRLLTEAGLTTCSSRAHQADSLTSAGSSLPSTTSLARSLP